MQFAEFQADIRRMQGIMHVFAEQKCRSHKGLEPPEGPLLPILSPHNVGSVVASGRFSELGEAPESYPKYGASCSTDTSRDPYYCNTCL